MIIFCGFCGFRWYAGADFANYVEIYNLVPFLLDFGLENTSHIHSEIGYKFLNSLFKSLSLASYFFFFFVASLSLYLKFRFYLKYSGNVYFCLAFYLALNFITFEFIQVRMGLAIAFLCVALHYYLVNKQLKALLFILVASTIHTVSIVFLIVFFVKSIKLQYLLALALCSLFVFSILDFLGFLVPLLLNVLDLGVLKSAANYMISEQYSNKATLLNLIPLRHFMVLCWLGLSLKKLENIGDINRTLIMIYVTGVLFSSFFMGVEILYARIQFIFDIVEPVVIYLLISSRKGKHVMLFQLIIVSLLVFGLMFKGVHTSKNIYEYTTWLNLII
jgi:hypothetical protein